MATATKNGQVKSQVDSKIKSWRRKFNQDKMRAGEIQGAAIDLGLNGSSQEEKDKLWSFVNQLWKEELTADVIALRQGKLTLSPTEGNLLQDNIEGAIQDGIITLDDLGVKSRLELSQLLR